MKALELREVPTPGEERIYRIRYADVFVPRKSISKANRYCSLRLFGIAFGAIHTTSNFLTNAIYDLAKDWDKYASELLDEHAAVVNEAGGLTEQTVSKLITGLVVTSQISVNGVEDANMRSLAAYVEQSDALLGVLSVRETIQFAARLRYHYYRHAESMLWTTLD